MKKFMILMLSLAVLFSFAACSNEGSNPGTTNPDDIAYVEGAVRNAKDYLVGETPDAADFIFTGYDVAGNVLVKDMASNLFTAEELKSGDKVVKFNGEIEIPVTVYDIDKFEVNSDKAVKTYYTVVATGDDAATTDEAYNVYRTVDKTGLVVTVTYDGTKTRTLDADDYEAVLGSISCSDFTEDKTWGTANPDAVVQVSFGDEEKTYPVTLAANLVSSIAVDVTDDYIVYYDESQTAAGTSDKLSASDVQLVATMVNGQTGKVLSTDAVFSASNATGAKFGTLDAIDLSNLSSVTVYAKYNGTDVVESYDSNTVVSSRSIDIKKDYAVGIQATATALNLTMGTDYAKDADPEQTKLDELTVKYIMASDPEGTASGDTLTLNADEDGYTITGPKGETKFTTEAGYIANRTVTITVKSGSWTDTVTATLVASGVSEDGGSDE